MSIVVIMMMISAVMMMMTMMMVVGREMTMLTKKATVLLQDLSRSGWQDTWVTSAHTWVLWNCGDDPGDDGDDGDDGDLEDGFARSSTPWQ